MTDIKLDFKTKLSGLKLNDWLGRIDELCDDLGYFEQLGSDHCVAFLEAGNNLLVTFESAETIQEINKDAEPLGFAFTRSDGWSHLALISFDESWFRDPAIYAYFDRLADDAFFEDFENILFHGVGSCGYAAAAFSVAAPGATVLALRPQATLEPRRAGWDNRYKSQRKLNFVDRYGYAPDMVDAAENVFIAFDPLQRLDAIHAALFTSQNVTALRAPAMGPFVSRAFDRIEIHDLMIRAAMAGTLDELSFAKLYRARRKDQIYLKSLLNRLIATNHIDLAEALCVYILRSGKNPYFSHRLRKLKANREDDQPLKRN